MIIKMYSLSINIVIYLFIECLNGSNLARLNLPQYWFIWIEWCRISMDDLSEPTCRMCLSASKLVLIHISYVLQRWISVITRWVQWIKIHIKWSLLTVASAFSRQLVDFLKPRFFFFYIASKSKIRFIQ